MELATLIIALSARVLGIISRIIESAGEDATKARERLVQFERDLDLAEARALGRIAGNDAVIDGQIGRGKPPQR